MRGKTLVSGTIVAMLFISMLMIAAPVYSAEGPIISLGPLQHVSGMDYKMEILIDNVTYPIRAWEATVTFNASYLWMDDAVEGTFLSVAGETYFAKDIYNIPPNGHVQVGCTLVGPAGSPGDPPTSGPYLLATLYFHFFWIKVSPPGQQPLMVHALEDTIVLDVNGVAKPHQVGAPVTYNLFFTTIQAAVNWAEIHVPDGAWILVNNGTYPENVNIPSTVTDMTIQAHDPGTWDLECNADYGVIVNGGGISPVFDVQGDGTLLTGMEIVNTPGTSGIWVDADDVTIDNCYIHSMSWGIYQFVTHSGTTIQYSKIVDCVVNGILMDATNTLIQGNFINNTGTGIEFSDSFDMTITANTITYNTGYGILMTRNTTQTMIGPCNTIKFNGIGIGISNNGYKAGDDNHVGVKINENIIASNTLWGLSIFPNAVEAVDARENYWGSKWGPTLNAHQVFPFGDGIWMVPPVTWAPWLINEAKEPVAVLKVDPPLNEFWAPVESTTFHVQIVIENVKDLYGFEFKLSWDPFLLSLEDWHLKVNQIYDQYFPIVEVDDIAGVLFVAVTSLDHDDGFTGTAAIINLWFHIDYDPCYIEPYWFVGCDLDLFDIILSDPSGQPENVIPYWAHDGVYINHAIPPKFEFLPTPVIIEGKDAHECYTFTFELWMLNATKLFDYGFVIVWDTDYIKLVDFTISREYLVGPFEYVYINETDYWLEVYIETKCWTPPLNGDGLLMTFTFHLEDPGLIWHKDDPSTHNATTWVWFDWWGISVKCPEPLWIDGIDFPELIAINDGEIIIYPVPGDVNFDGNVDETDLLLVASHFCDIDGLYDLNDDGHVDILDLVIVAKRICISGC